MLRIYLDNCCFNRPYDDPRHLVTYLEAEAKLFVQKAIIENKFELTWSYVLDYENSANPHMERKNAIAGWRKVAKIDIDASIDVTSLGKKIMEKGIKDKDALHIACAIKAKCDYFLTTDKKILNKDILGITTINPLDFVRKLEVQNNEDGYNN